MTNDIKGIFNPSFFCLFLLYSYSIIRMKLDSSELEGSPSSTEVAVAQTAPSNNMKTQAAFVNKLYK